MIMILFKICGKCKIEKPIENFSKSLSRKDGYQVYCKSCIPEINKITKESRSISKKAYYETNKEIISTKAKEYYEKNRDIILVNVKNYRENNKEKVTECNRNYYLKNKHNHIVYQEANRDKIRLRMKLWRENNNDEITEYDKKYREENKDILAERSRLYYYENKEKCNKRSNEYRKNNPEKLSAINSKRRSVKLNATPKWLSKKDLESIEELFICARMFRLYTGQDYHVDHIIPLQGKNVCGLHVPWNLQVIPAKENLSKSNKIE